MHATWGLDDQDQNDWDYEECKTAGDPNIPVATVTACVRVTAMIEKTCLLRAMLSVYLLLPCARAMGARMRRMMLSMIVSIMREKIQRRWIAPCGSKRGVFTEARSTCDG